MQGFGADHAEARQNRNGSGDAARRHRFLQHQRRQRQADHRSERWLDQPAVAERHQQEAGVAEDRERQRAKHRERSAASPADTGKRAEVIERDEWQESEAGPDETM